MTTDAGPRGRGYLRQMTDPHTALGPAAKDDLVGGFERARVVDAMHPGVVSCPPDASMAAVGRMMATNGVHAVVVSGVFGSQAWGVVTDADVLAVAAEADHRMAGSCATGELVTVSPGEPLARAAELMLEHGVSHLMVFDRGLDLPLGVISTLDVARVVGGGPPRARSSGP